MMNVLGRHGSLRHYLEELHVAIEKKVYVEKVYVFIKTHAGSVANFLPAATQSLYTDTWCTLVISVSDLRV